MATAQKTVKKDEKKNGKFSSAFAAFLIPICLLVGFLIYIFVMGNPSNFEGGDPANHPVKEGAGSILGLIHKGGWVVPVLLSFILINISVSIERYITLRRASGKESAQVFISKIRGFLANNDTNGAIAACDKQKGSVANVVKQVMIAYQKLEQDNTMDLEKKMLALQKEVEEATSLELPMLEKNLIILATLSSVSTLVALLGTVLGMIRAFAALGTGGAPDSAALAVGISEALINTALGIGNSAISAIMYATYTSKIDGMTYAIDEAGYSIVQTYAEKHR